MHTYLRAIGFSKIQTQADAEELIKSVLCNAGSRTVGNLSENCNIIEYRTEYAENIGITVRGEEDENGNFHYSHFFPYLSAKKISTNEEIFIHKKVDTEAFTGMCDDPRVGVSLIFYVQNVAEYINTCKKTDFSQPMNIPVYMAALARSGKVILPTQKRVYSKIAEKLENDMKTRLMEDARNGDVQAIESLTMNDIDKYAVVSERIKHEDLFSIVETSFIPFGSESDVYNILANIVVSRQLYNTQTGERIWVLRCNCNKVEFDVCINADDLMGEPMPGMRFKGIVWLQGKVAFSGSEEN